ncbi:MAG: LPS export ABC transporter permease LptG [Candidatus Omnitrophica bacterium]|nr:LPS export ABC transporter permease LptG [Candidatus Omnitrophota bacterium]
MRIIDRYIFKSVFSSFLGCILTFQFLYVIIDLFSNLDDLLKQKAKLTLLGLYYLSYLPVIFIQVTPVACLLATIYTLGILNKNNEVTALRASGLSVWRIARVAIIFGAVISVLVFMVNERIVPSAQNSLVSIRNEIQSQGAKRPEESIIKNMSIYGQQNRLFFVNKFSIKENRLDGIVILEHDRHQELIKKIVASSGIWEDKMWKFYDSITYNFDQSGQIEGEPTYFKEELMDIRETPADFLKQRQHPEYMNISQLKSYISILSKSGAKTVIRNFKVDLYQRFTFPLTSLVIIILGIPFALMIKKRASALSSIGISILLGFLYYVFSAVSLAFGKAGFLPPYLAASLAHIVFLGFGLYKIYTTP